MTSRNTFHASASCKSWGERSWRNLRRVRARHPDAVRKKATLKPMKAKPRVLVLSATSGAGHVRAAQALEKAFMARGDCTVEHIDALQNVSKLFRRVYDKAYISMVRRAPE